MAEKPEKFLIGPDYCSVIPGQDDGGLNVLEQLVQSGVSGGHSLFDHGVLSRLFSWGRRVESSQFNDGLNSSWRPRAPGCYWRRHRSSRNS